MIGLKGNCSASLVSWLAIGAAFSFVSVSSALASTTDFKVVGCDGSPRALRTVQEGSLSTVEIRVSDETTGAPASNVSFELKRLSKDSSSNSQGAPLTSSIVDGRGAFQGVAAGEWSVCPAATVDSQKNLSVTQVAIINTESESSNKTTWLGVGGVAVTGLGLGILSGSGGSSSETLPSSTGDFESQPVVPSDSGVQALRPAESSSSEIGGLDKPACASTEDCLTGQRPPPLSPIS